MNNFQNTLTINTLDRLLAFFQATSSRPSIGDTLYQGTNMPQVVFVSSDNGSNSNDGRDPRTPLATLEEALDHVQANRGDVIFIMPGHTEAWTADVVIDVAGITIIGLGQGVDRPTFTIGDAAGESLDIAAASVILENLVFVCGVDQQTWMIGIRATDCSIRNCEFREGTALQPLIMLDIGAGAAANAADRASVINCVFKSPTAGDGDSAIKLSAISNAVRISGCNIWGDYDDACIHNPIGFVCTDLEISDCILSNVLTGQHAIELVSACTGNLIRNLYHSDLTQATASDPGSCFSYECYHDDVVDTSAIISPAVT